MAAAPAPPISQQMAATLQPAANINPADATCVDRQAGIHRPTDRRSLNYCPGKAGFFREVR